MGFKVLRHLKVLKDLLPVIGVRRCVNLRQGCSVGRRQLFQRGVLDVAENGVRAQRANSIMLLINFYNLNLLSNLPIFFLWIFHIKELMKTF